MWRLTRRKTVDWDNLGNSSLARRLNIFDLTLIGIGGTLGAGAYVIAGVIAKNKAGPAACLSFFVACVASVLAGICYAEFGARVPLTGSAYTFTYVTIGEFVAFVIGWNLLLEYIIGSASVARTASNYLDALIGDKIEPALNESMPMDVPGLAEYADPVALGIAILITIILAIGVKESSMFNNIFTVVNLCILSFIIFAGIPHDDTANWKIAKENVTHVCGSDHASSCGEGGFNPYGFNGIISGAATAFFAYVGFDAIATAGEEVKNPQRNIPLSIVISLSIISVIYFALTMTVTMMAPYFLIDDKAPLSTLFVNVGWNWAKYLVGVGALCALSTSLFGGMFPMPRVVLAMARDGVIFRFFAYVHPSSQTPIPATFFMGLLTGIMAMLFDVDALADMMSIGTLMAYTLVATSVLLLRFELGYLEKREMKLDKDWTVEYNKKEPLFQQMFYPKSKRPTRYSSRLVKALVSGLGLWIIPFCILLTFAPAKVFSDVQIWAVIIFVVLLILILGSVLSISRQPQSTQKLSFKVPFAIVLCPVSMFFNVYLMMNLSYMTWIRFGVWIAIGLVVYFGYGMMHSSEEQNRRRSSNRPSEVYIIETKMKEFDSDKVSEIALRTSTSTINTEDSAM